MAVGADKSLAGNAKAFKVYLMANAVAGTAEVDAVLFCNRANKAVVVCVFKSVLESVVVNI